MSEIGHREGRLATQ